MQQTYFISQHFFSRIRNIIYQVYIILYRKESLAHLNIAKGNRNNYDCMFREIDNQKLYVDVFIAYY